MGVENSVGDSEAYKDFFLDEKSFYLLYADYAKGK